MTKVVQVLGCALLLISVAADVEAKRQKKNKWNCSIYAYDAKTGIPSQMSCPINGVVTFWRRVDNK